MNAIPTMPSPTTTTFLRCDGGLGYLSASFSSSVRAFGGSLLIAMPGEEVAHDIVRWSWLTNVSTGAATTHEKEKPNRIRTVRAARQGKFGGMLIPKSNMSGKKSLRGGIVDDDPISRSTASSDRTGLSGPLQLSAKSFKGLGRPSIGRKDQNVHISADRATSRTYPFSVEDTCKAYSAGSSQGSRRLIRSQEAGWHVVEIRALMLSSIWTKWIILGMDWLRFVSTCIIFMYCKFRCRLYYHLSYPRRSSPSGKQRDCVRSHSSILARAFPLEHQIYMS
jgi:hypothetical protein